MTTLYESNVEQLVIELLKEQGYSYLSPEAQETERLTSDKILKNKSSIYTLENLRDILLPKLMGNTVKVNGIERTDI